MNTLRKKHAPAPPPGGMRGKASAWLAFALMAMSAGLIACEAYVETEQASSSRVNLIVVGDSLSAGHQNACTIHYRQVHGYAKMLANQAGLRLDLPLIGEPGARPCFVIDVDYDLTTIHRAPVGPGGTGDPNDPIYWGARLDPTVQPNNLATPASRLVDAFSAPPDNDFHGNFLMDYLAMWSLILNTPNRSPNQSMIAQAVNLAYADAWDRDVIILWLGSGDALWSALGGIDWAVTPVETFHYVYDLALGALADTGADIVVANIPDLTLAPHFIPVEIADCFGLLVLDGPPMGIAAGDKLTLAGLESACEIIAGINPPPLADSDFLTPTEIANIQDTIAGYNASIAALASAHGAVLVDIAALLDDADANGYPVGVDTLTTDYCGGIFSLDGVHPSHTGYAIIANRFIAAMNAGLGFSIPPVDEAEIWASEPAISLCLAGPYL